MKFKLMAIVMAGALALGTFAPRVQAEDTQPAPQNEYARAYLQTLDEVKLHYFNQQTLSYAQWRVLKAAAAAITNQEQLESAFGVLTTYTHGEIRLLDHHDSDSLRASIAGGRVGFGLELATSSMVGTSVRVGDVEEGSMAEAAGLRAGDYITSIDGEPVGYLTSVREALAKFEKPPGSKTRVELRHADSPDYINVTVENDLDGATGVKFVDETSVPVTYIDDVDDGSTAQAAGLKVDDHILSVNGQPMGDASEVKEVLELATYLGESVTLEIERAGLEHLLKLTVPCGITLNWSDYFSFEAEGTAADIKGPWQPSTLRSNWVLFGVKSFEWHDEYASNAFQEFAEEHQSSLLAVLDLEDSQGNDMDSAAIVASQFVPEGLVMSFSLAYGGQLRYYVRGGDLVRQEIPSQGLVRERVLRHNIKTSSSRLAVLVNGATSGVTKAVAFNLRAAGRATIVGSTTGEDPMIVGYVPVVAGGRTLMLSMPVALMLRPDGTTLGAVQPDHPAETGAREVALDLMAGIASTPAQSQYGLVGWLVLLGLMLLLVVTFAWRSRTRTANGQSERKPDKPPASVFSWLSTVMLSLLGLTLAVLVSAMWIIENPPIGGHSEVLVQFITDGSPESEKMGVGFYALRNEISDGARFEVIDVRQHPEYLWSTANHNRHAVDSVPFIWVLKVNYDRHGQEVTRGGSGGAGTYYFIKRHLLSQIRWYASNTSGRSFPVEIKRKPPRL